MSSTSGWSLSSRVRPLVFGAGMVHRLIRPARPALWPPASRQRRSPRLDLLGAGLATLSAFGVFAASSALTGAELFAALGALAANAVLPARLPAVDAASAAMPVLASVGASAGW